MALNLTTAQAAVITACDTSLETAFQTGVLNNGSAFLPAMTGYSSDQTIGGGIAAKAASIRTLIKQSYEAGFAALITGMAASPISSFCNLSKAAYSRNGSTGQTVSTGSSSILNFDTKEYDTDNAVTVGASWHFTVPTGKSGVYRVSASCSLSTGAVTPDVFLAIYKNNGEIRRGNRGSLAISQVGGFTVSGSLNCAAGDTLDVRIFQNSGGSLVTEAAPATFWITIEGPF
jgi:hypothetical protein